MLGRFTFDHCKAVPKHVLQVFLLQTRSRFFPLAELDPATYKAVKNYLAERGTTTCADQIVKVSLL